MNRDNPSVSFELLFIVASQQWAWILHAEFQYTKGNCIVFVGGLLNEIKSLFSIIIKNSFIVGSSIGDIILTILF